MKRFVDPGRVALVLAWLLPGLAGCGGPDLARDWIRGEEKAALSVPAAPTTAAPAPLPPEVEAALLPAAPGTPPSPPSRDQTFDIAVEGIDAAAFFTSLSESTHYNVVVHSGVTGTLSLRLSRVSVPEIVDTACRLNGYHCERQENRFLIFPADLESEEFQVHYLDLQRTGLTRTRVSVGQDAIASREQRASLSGKGVREVTEYASFGSELVTESESRYWDEVTHALCNQLGLSVSGGDKTGGGDYQEGRRPGRQTPPNRESRLGCAEVVNDAGRDGRRVTVTPHTGAILVRAYPAELRTVRKFLDNQTRSLERQVVLEAKILEVALDDGFQSGVNWASLLKQGSGAAILGMTGGGSLLGEAATSPLFSSQTGAGGYNPSDLADAAANPAFGGAFFANVAFSDFDAFIELLKTQGEVRVLSSPRVSTLNNQKAVIRVGQDEMFITDFKYETTTSGDNQLSTLVPKFSTYFSGIALDVTPKIDDHQRIMLQIHPMVSEVVNDEKVMTVGTETWRYPLALNRVRETDSLVMARHGEVVVIGGLMKSALDDREAGIPVLSRLPLLGGLFRHDRQVLRKSELVILVRPTVVDRGEDWSRELEQVRERLGTGLP